MTAKAKSKRKGKKSKKKGRGYMMATSNQAVLATVPRGLPRGPDAFFPRVFKTCLHTRIADLVDPGSTPATASILVLNLSKAGNPHSTNFSYGVSAAASARNDGTASDVDGSIQRDPLNLFNYYGQAYVTYAVVRATFIPDGMSNTNHVPALGCITQALNFPGIGESGVETQFKEAFALQVIGSGGTLANLEEVPGVMTRIINASVMDKCTTMQRGFRMKPVLGAQTMIGDEEYATSWNRETDAIVAPDNSVKCGVICKDLRSNLDPPQFTRIVDVYQVTLFVNPRPRDLTQA